MASRSSRPASKAAARPENASEVAQVLSELAADHQALPKNAAEDLHRLLAHSLAARGPAERRLAKLGLLIELVAAGHGEYITVAVYEEARLKRLGRGEEHPDASTLVRAYGHWLSALTAAARFWHRGGEERVAASHAHSHPHASYKPEEIVSALIECQRDLATDGIDGAVDGEGDNAAIRWPSEWEYLEYAAICRQLARRAGKAVRLPGAKQIRKAFGSFAAAVAEAERIRSRR